MKTDNEETPDTNTPGDADSGTGIGTKKAGPREFTENPKAIAIWMTPTTKKKLDILKAEMDVTWSLFLEIVCEQLLATGVVSKEARNELRALGSPSVDISSGDRYWRAAFGIGESWPEAAASQAKIIDELTLTNSLLGELVQAVEDHGTMLVECEHIITLEEAEA